LFVHVVDHTDLYIVISRYSWTIRLFK